MVELGFGRGCRRTVDCLLLPLIGYLNLDRMFWGISDWKLEKEGRYFLLTLSPGTRVSRTAHIAAMPSRRLKLNLKILAKPSFIISTKIQITSTKHQQKKLTKLQLQISPLLQLRNLDQTLCSKSEQKFSFLTKPQLPNLQQIVANTILFSNSYNINKI